MARLTFMSYALPNSNHALKALAAQLLQRLEERSAESERQRLELDRRDAQIKEQSAFIEKLKFELARLKRWRFGKSAEGLSAEQLSLWECELDADIANLQSRIDALDSEDQHSGKQKDQPKRRPLPASLPREEVLHDLASKACPDCGEGLTRIGEEITEQLDIIPARFFVRRHVRPKYCCRHCQSVHTAALPAKPIDKGIAAPGLIAHVAIGKYLDHLPLYRQESIFERMGMPIPRSTMAGWFGELEILIEPLVGNLIEKLTAQCLLHADETPVPVLDPGAGKTATGYLWAYRTGPWSPLQAVAYDFTMSRAAEAPKRFLAGFTGTLLVDGYAGYNQVLARPGMIEAGCLAHARRYFREVFEATRSPIAQHALIQFGKLYAIECEVKHLAPEARALERQRRAAPILAQFKQWLDITHANAPPKSAIGKALAYSINRWRALTRYLDDGWLNIDNNPVENALRGIALGRKNWLFAGSEAGGRRAALFYTLIETAKLNDVNPHAYLVDVLTQLPTAKAKDLDALLPWNFRPKITPADTS